MEKHTISILVNVDGEDLELYSGLKLTPINKDTFLYSLTQFMIDWQNPKN